MVLERPCLDVNRLQCVKLLAKQNLQCAEYRMPAKRNRPESYDAKLNKPSPKKQGIIKLGALTPTESDSAVANSTRTKSSFATVVLISVSVAFGWVMVGRRRRESRSRWLKRRQ